MFKAKPPVTRRSNRRKQQKQTGSPSTLQALKSDGALAIGNDTDKKVLLEESSAARGHLILSSLKEKEREQQGQRETAVKREHL